MSKNETHKEKMMRKKMERKNGSSASTKEIEYTRWDWNWLEVDCEKSLTRPDIAEYINWLVWDDTVSPSVWKFSMQKLRYIFRELTSDLSVERKSMEFFGHNGKTKLEIIYTNRKDEPTAILIKDFRSKDHLDELNVHYMTTAYPEICLQQRLLVA